jgi:hypothetical protein
MVILYKRVRYWNSLPNVCDLHRSIRDSQGIGDVGTIRLFKVTLNAALELFPM